MREQKLQRIQKTLLRLHICVLVIIAHFTLKAFTATDLVPKTTNIFIF